MMELGKVGTFPIKTDTIDVDRKLRDLIGHATQHFTQDIFFFLKIRGIYFQFCHFIVSSYSIVIDYKGAHSPGMGRQ
jgi:hypothetical protein